MGLGMLNTLQKKFQHGCSDVKGIYNVILASSNIVQKMLKETVSTFEYCTDNNEELIGISGRSSDAEITISSGVVKKHSKVMKLCLRWVGKELLNARIIIYWMFQVPSYLICMSPNNFGPMSFSLLVISLIECPPWS